MKLFAATKGDRVRFTNRTGKLTEVPDGTYGTFYEWYGRVAVVYFDSAPDKLMHTPPEDLDEFT